MAIVNPVRNKLLKATADMQASRISNVVKIKEERCKGCQLCINFCPRGALGISKKMNKRGFHPAEVINMGKCTGCGICFLVCPDVAIEIYEPRKK